MPDTSIRVLPKYYGGSDEKKRRKYREEANAAKQIEDYIKQKMSTEHSEREYAQFLYFDIANELYLDELLVSKLLRPAGGGQSGITIVRRPK